LQTYKEIGDHLAESKICCKLGMLSKELKEERQAQEYFEQALIASRKVGDAMIEGETLYNIGILYFDKGHHKGALAFFLLAGGILSGMQSPLSNVIQNQIKLLLEKVDDAQYRTLLVEVKEHPLQITEEVLREGIS